MNVWSFSHPAEEAPQESVKKEIKVSRMKSSITGESLLVALPYAVFLREGLQKLDLTANITKPGTME